MRSRKPMDPLNRPVALLSEPLRAEIREIVLEAIREAMNGNKTGPQKNPPKPYLTIKEAADSSRLGTSTIRLYIRRRELRACQIGSRIIIKRTDLERFLEGHPLEILAD